jgi:hypothetical protein
MQDELVGKQRRGRHQQDQSGHQQNGLRLVIPYDHRRSNDNDSNTYNETQQERLLILAVLPTGSPQ